MIKAIFLLAIIFAVLAKIDFNLGKCAKEAREFS